MSSAKRRKKRWTGICFLLPSLVGTGVFLWIPFLDVIRRSFMGAVNGEWKGLENYRIILNNTAFRLASWNTLRFVAVCIPLLIVLSLMIAVLLQRMGRYGKMLKSAFLVPMAIPAASMVLLWKLVFHNRGYLNGLLAAAGLQGCDWMNTGVSFGVLVFSYLWKNIGYDVVLWMAGLSGISESIYEAARVDGAGSWQCFIKITMPCLKPSLYTIAVLSLLNSFKVFREAWLVSGDYPQDEIYLLQHVFNNWYRNLDLDKMAAGAVLTGAVIFIMVLFLQKTWEGGRDS